MMNSTLIRVPWMQGFPPRTEELDTIRGNMMLGPSSQFYHNRTCTVLPLHPSAGIPAHQRQHLVFGYIVEIALYRVLEATRRDREFQRPLRPGKVGRVQGTEQTGGKRIAGADPIDDVA